MINWTDLTSEAQLENIFNESKEKPVLIFKHSSRCSISQTALDRLERNWSPEATGKTKAYFLDLLTYRDVSNRVADFFEVQHESPQVLVVRNGKPVHVQSHLAITFSDINAALSTN